MKKKISLIALLLCMNLGAFALAKSLVIDNQTPGWLSSKINYGDQLTVESLTLSGYYNSEDLKFIGSLIENNSLKKRLILDNATIVGTSVDENNKLGTNIFGLTKNDTIEYISLPIGMISADNCFGIKVYSSRYTLYVDTLVVGGKAMHAIKYKSFSTDGRYSSNYNIDNMILREGVDTIGEEAFSQGDGHVSNLKRIILPQSLKYIGGSAFSKCMSLDNIQIPDGVEEIRDKAFYESGYAPDTLYLPKSLKKVHTRAFNKVKVLYIGENIEEIDNVYEYRNPGSQWQNTNYYNGEKIEIHINKVSPPKWIYHYIKELDNATVYVPYGASKNYNSELWSYATIIEEKIDVSGIKLNYSKYEMKNLEDTLALVATVYPENASFKDVKWSSSNESVCVVSNGNVISVGYGTAVIIAETVDGGYKAECLVKVKQPVTEVKLSKHDLTLNIGESKELSVDVFPTNADDKSVIWTSGDESVVSVNNIGKVTGVNSGKTMIYVKAKENELIADSCEVMVAQPVTGIILNETQVTFDNIGDTKTIVANVLPENATNKAVRWNSSNVSVCLVTDNGTLVALANGLSVITVTTVDGGFAAVCVVTVDENSGIESIKVIDKKDYKVYDLNGVEQKNFVNGVNIIKIKNGGTYKIMYNRY